MAFHLREFEDRFCESMRQVLDLGTMSCIGVGVSGGADSLALTYLLQCWSKRYKPKLEVVPFIVDHGVRPQARQEALHVAGWLRNWGLKPEILCCARGLRGNQAVLRQARYEQLILACHQRGARHLCLGHHQDDVLETLWMRQQQGSGWRGLAGISSERIQWEVCILRPLLAWPKCVLRQILQAIHHPWMEDPSNAQPCFQRTHARAWVQQQSSAERAALWKQTLQRAKIRHTESLAIQEKCSGQFWKGGLCLPREALDIKADIPEFWVLSQWLNSVFPRRAPLGRKALERAWHQLIPSWPRKGGAKVLFTLGGVLGLVYQDNLYCVREWGRIKAAWGKRAPWLWDRRFIFTTLCRKDVSPKGWAQNVDAEPNSSLMARYGEASFPSADVPYRYVRPCLSCPIFKPPWGGDALRGAF